VALNIGDVVDGKYRIVRLLGEGGMGAVYEGENTRIHRRVAIKVLHSTVAQAQDAVQRFEREAQAAGRIGNQHIVEVLDLGNLPDGDRYMVMEFLEGESLAERIKTRGRLPAAEVCNVALGMLEGLAAAHDVGIIHRDLKPDNVFLVKRGGQDFVKLVDFGISKFNVVGGEFSMTRTGAVMGTPYYMSPEQAKGTRDIDHRVDLYAAGVILYEAVSGQVPFDAETFNELLFKIVLEDAPPVTKIVPELDAGFAQIVDKARSKDPGQRYQTARDFQQALQQWAGGAKVDFSFGATQAFSGTPPLGTASSTMGRATANAWAQSGEQAVPGKNKTWLLLAVAVVVLLGGILLALKLSSESEGAARAAEAAQTEQARMAAEAVKDKEVAVKARQEAESAAQAASEKVKQAEAAAALAQQQAAQQAQGSAGAPSVRPLPPGTPSAVAVKPKVASKPAPVAAPSAKPSTSTGTSGSRKIRTSL
jgi:serine/threonine-protein kinase